MRGRDEVKTKRNFFKAIEKENAQKEEKGLIQNALEGLKGKETKEEKRKRRRKEKKKPDKKKKKNKHKKKRKKT